MVLSGVVDGVILSPVSLSWIVPAWFENVMIKLRDWQERRVGNLEFNPTSLLWTSVVGGLE